MPSIRIIGAGSIGNHLANAARTRGWDVCLTDKDTAALDRAKTDIYPSRYGAWDAGIELASSDDAKDRPADVIFIGTPPDSHIPLALDALDRVTPKAIVIEKPLAGPDMIGVQKLKEVTDAKGVFAAVGYNHCLGLNTVAAEKAIQSGMLGTLQTITAKTREHWQGIFKAHPWLAGPAASYLGFSSKGGGATGEHSHAINIWQHFAHVTGAGRIVEVSATLDWVKAGGCEYDRAMFAAVTTSEGLKGDLIQDVVTAPTDKSARLQGDEGFVEWIVGASPGHDAIVTGKTGAAPETTPIAKTRADDFIAEIDHLSAVLDGTITNSPIELTRGLDTLMVIAAIFRSDAEGRRVRIDWSKGYVPEAII